LEGAWRSRSWGKHFLIELPGYALRIHFLMSGICPHRAALEQPAAEFDLGAEYSQTEYQISKIVIGLISERLLN
jgi:hypothetical protein